jgi:hypothetical protein
MATRHEPRLGSFGRISDAEMRVNSQFELGAPLWTADLVFLPTTVAGLAAVGTMQPGIAVGTGTMQVLGIIFPFYGRGMQSYSLRAWSRYP